MRPSEGRRTAARLILSLLVLGAVYAGLATFVGRHVAANTRVDGVSIGGMSPRQASVTLTRALAAKASRPVTLRTPSRSVLLDPATAGLALDVDATVAGQTGFSLAPADVWRHLTGGEDLPLRISVDDARLTAALQRAATTVNTPVREGSVSLAGGTVHTVLSQPGHTLEVARTAEGGGCGLAAPTGDQRGRRRRGAHARGRRDQARRRRLRPSGGLRPADGQGRFAADRADAREARLGRQPEADAAGPTRPDGRRRQDRCAAALGRARGGEAPRRCHGDAGRWPADGRAGRGRHALRRGQGPGGGAGRADLARPDRDGRAPCGPSPRSPPRWRGRGASPSVVSSFSTAFPVNPPRTTNITIAARTLDGTLVKPGETFSLNGVLGQRTGAKGYQKAPVINGGRLETRLRRWGLAGLDHDLQRRVLRRGADRAAHAALVLHLPLPRGARGDRLVAGRRQPVDQRHAARRS